MARKLPDFKLLNCEFCNVEFTILKRNIQAEGNYCSDECRKHRYIKKCQSCGAEFNSPKNDTKYCSNECIKKG